MTENHPNFDNSDIVMEQYTPMADRERRIKRLQFRANHRGMREMDIIIGGFADSHADTMTDDELDQLEFILSIHDAELSKVLVGLNPPPKILEVIPMFHRLISYRDDRMQQK